MAARCTDTVEQAAQIGALRSHTDWLFFHEVVAAFTDSYMCLGGCHEGSKNIQLEVEWSGEG